MIAVQPFYTPDMFAVSVGVEALRCDDPSCGALHGYSFYIQLFCWGIEIQYMTHS